MLLKDEDRAVENVQRIPGRGARGGLRRANEALQPPRAPHAMHVQPRGRVGGGGALATILALGRPTGHEPAFEMVARGGNVPLAMTRARLGISSLACVGWFHNLRKS